VIRRLSDLQYLNDQAYAERWADRRLATRPMGEERLKAELQAKGIPDVSVGRVVADIFREVDEETLAHRAVKAVQRSGRLLTSSQMVRLLHQRGFREETIDRMIEEFRMNEEPIHEE
jgi:regulatory protein